MSVLMPTKPSTSIPPTEPRKVRESFHSRFANRSRLYLALALLLLPTVGAVLLFTYYPQFSAVKYSFFRWDGQQTEEYRGLENFTHAFGKDTIFWASFQLTFILLLANLVKMWPSILTAVVLHRLRSERWQYIYRVLFVIPMIIPGLVMLLIWKSFFDPSNGVLNKFLNATGLMPVLQWADIRLPQLANTMSPLKNVVDYTFGSVWGLSLVGVMLLLALPRFRSIAKQTAVWTIPAIVGFLLWVVWMKQWAHFAVWTSVAYGVPVGLQMLAGRDVKEKVARWGGVLCLAAAVVTLFTTMMWTKETHAFENASPVWLGHTQLIIPALIFWGFPWVGTVGVLIYLAGLQAISNDVYEAGELDGLSTFGKLWHIELPLILTQVRINLVFMTIGTLTDYGLILLLLGPGGGPQNVGMVPGLYAYRKAFIENEYGYACALGMVMFVMILIITIIYQKVVKVDK